MRNLVFRPGTEPRPPALGAQSVSYWATTSCGQSFWWKHETTSWVTDVVAEIKPWCLLQATPGDSACVLGDTGDLRLRINLNCLRMRGSQHCFFEIISVLYTSLFTKFRLEAGEWFSYTTTSWLTLSSSLCAVQHLSPLPIPWAQLSGIFYIVLDSASHGHIVNEHLWDQVHCQKYNKVSYEFPLICEHRSTITFQLL